MVGSLVSLTVFQTRPVLVVLYVKMNNWCGQYGDACSVYSLVASTGGIWLTLGGKKQVCLCIIALRLWWLPLDIVE